MTAAADPVTRFVGVGIGEYEDPFFGPLRAPEQVRQVAETMARLGVSSVVATAQTEAALHGELPELLKDPGGGADLLVVLWAGHADPLPDEPLRLVARDSRRDGVALLTPKLLTALALRSGARQILLLFDVCHAGGGVIPAMASADAWLGARAVPDSRSWIGVVGSSMEWERARDGLFGDVLLRILSEGPRDAEVRSRWSTHNARVRGDDLIDAVLKDWSEDAPHRPKPHQAGSALPLLPNPLYVAPPPRGVDARLLLAARGGDADDSAWYFSGRAAEIARVAGWVAAAEPGIRVVTGPRGCGKSALLGLVASLSLAEHREDALTVLTAQHDAGSRAPDGGSATSLPALGSVHANVHAGGSTRTELVRALDEQLTDAGVLPGDRRGRRGPGELVDAVGSALVRPVIVIDGLDDAGVEAWPIVTQVLRPLSGHALVIIGTRDIEVADSTDGETGAATLLDRLRLDEGAVLELTDDAAAVRAYVKRRLAGVDAAMDPEAVADALVALPPRPEEESLFLVARTWTTRLRARPLDTSLDGWAGHLTAGVTDLFDDYLAGLPPLVRDGLEIPHAAREIAGALAWTEGAGFPADVWALAATASSPTGTAYTRDDVHWARGVAAEYIAEAGEDGQAAYRLPHQVLVQHLREQAPAEAQQRIARAFVDHYLGAMEAGAEPTSLPYLWRHTWRHCADAGSAGLADLERLAAADPENFRFDLALALAYLAAMERERQSPAEAIVHAERSIELLRGLPEDDVREMLPETLGNLGLYRLEAADFAGAVRAATEARDLYDAMSTGDEGPRADATLNLSNLGLFLGQTGDPRALDHLEEACRRYRDLARTDPSIALDLARTLGNLTWQYVAAGRSQDAVAAAREATTILQASGVDTPAVARDLARNTGNLALALLSHGSPAEAIPFTLEACERYRALRQRTRATDAELALYLSNLAAAYIQTGDFTAAEESASEACDILREVVAHDAIHAPVLARALGNLGLSVGARGDTARAVAISEEAIAVCRPVIGTNPMIAGELARVLTNNASMLREIGRLEEALASIRDACETYSAAPDPASLTMERLRALDERFRICDALGLDDEARLSLAEFAEMTQQPIAADTRQTASIVLAFTGSANAFAAAGRHDDAIATHTRARDALRALVDPTDAQTAILASVLGNVAAALENAGRPQEATGPAAEASGLLRVLSGRDPAHVPEFARNLSNLGLIQARTGDVASGIRALEDACGIYLREVAEHPELRRMHAGAAGNLGAILVDAGRAEEGLEQSSEAIRILRDLRAEGEDVALELARNLNNLGMQLFVLERIEESVDATAQACGLLREEAGGHVSVIDDLAVSSLRLGLRMTQVRPAAECLAPIDEATALFRQRIAERPDFASELALALFLRGAILSDLERPDEALDDLAESIGLYEQLPLDESAYDLARAHLLRGEILVDVGRGAEARDGADRATRLAEDLSDSAAAEIIAEAEELRRLIDLRTDPRPLDG